MHMSTMSSPLMSRVVDRHLVTRLQQHRCDPSVSVLLTTTPGVSLATADVVRLHGLLNTADRRLRLEASREHADAIMKRLRRLAVDARRNPAGRALALFASADHAEAVLLQVTVKDRVVVDPTFATRDLLRNLLANPRFRLLVLAAGGTRLFEGRPDRLAEVADNGFPVAGDGGSGRGDRSSRFGRDRSDVRDATMRAHLRAVDNAVVARHRREPMPMVIAGESRQLAAFRAMSSEPDIIVGEIPGGHARTPTSRLAQLVRPVIEEHRVSQRNAAMSRLHAGLDRGRVVGGIDAVWVAAVDHRVGLLCVEEGYAMPAHVSGGGRRVEPAADAEEPGVLDDSIDELIELVILDGGEVELIPDGALAPHSRVAALLL